MREQGASDNPRYRNLVFQGAPAPRRQFPKRSRSAALGTPRRPALLPPPVRPSVKDPIDVPEAHFVWQVFRQAGLDAVHYRLAPLVRRIPACLRALRVRTPQEAARLLADDPRKVPLALDALLVGVTGFFRDEPVFEQLRARVIPRLVASREHPRVWSIACSDGAELYSVAMLLAEAGRLGLGALYGTDCRPAAVEAAARGVYAAAAVDKLQCELLRKYFVASGGVYRIGSDLRAAVQWKVADVFAELEPGPWDLVLCRNLAIYLDAAAGRALMAGLAEALAPGGVLVVGKAERAAAPGLRRLGPCMYEKG